jgi:hypothetical protein
LLRQSLVLGGAPAPLPLPTHACRPPGDLGGLLPGSSVCRLKQGCATVRLLAKNN